MDEKKNNNFKISIPYVILIDSPIICYTKETER